MQMSAATRATAPPALIAFVAEAGLDVSILDREGRIIEASAITIARTGLPREQVVGARIQDLFGEVTHEVCRLLLTDAIAVPTTIPPVCVPMPGGELMWIQSILNPWRDEAGEVGGVICTNHNMTAEQRALSELSRAETLLDAIVDSIPSLLLVQEHDTGIVARVNRATEEFLGVARDEILGQPLTRCSQVIDEAHLARLRKALAGGKTVSGEEVFSDGAGRPRTHSIRRSLISDRDGRLHILSVAEDITDVRNDKEALRRAAAEAEAANRAKSEFLANMSHEIRTPLNGVMGVAGALARTPLAPDQQEMVSIIETSAKTLETLLSDILDLARIEAGRMELRPEPFDLGGSVNACVAVFEAAAHAKGLDMKVAVDGDALGSYVGDAGRIRQILSNLLGNAVKFTTHGAVSLKISARRDEVSSILRFEVRDSGIGFDAETKARLFSRFQQADGSITRRFGGSGLGLAISRSLAEAMGGCLEADACPGKGATFTFTLELPRCEGAAEVWSESQEREVAANPLVGLRVLLAEDHPTNRRVVELILGAAGVDLTCVENGAEAVEAFQANPFDLVLMDMQMPVMDGLTAIREIRRGEQASGSGRTPIYVLTANAMPEHVGASVAAGADDHISKPIRAEALLEAVGRVAADAGEPAPSPRQLHLSA